MKDIKKNLYVKTWDMIDAWWDIGTVIHIIWQEKN